MLSTGQCCIDEDESGLLLYGVNQFLYPFGIAVNPSDGGVYVADTGQFQYSFGIATNPITGNVYVADTYNQRIEQFSTTGQFVRQWGRREELDNLSSPLE